MARGLFYAGALLFVAAVTTSADGGEEACGRCKPKKAAWPWKANGYAVGAEEAKAAAEAEAAARQSACKQAVGYLDSQKLRCAAGCEEGALETACEPSKKPLCTSGNGEKNAGMWKFVCQKATGDPAQCDDAAREASPFYAMCDVSVKAERVLACGDPECGS